MARKKTPKPDGYIIMKNNNSVRAVYTFPDLKGTRFYDRTRTPGGRTIYKTKKEAEKEKKSKTRTKTTGRKKRRRRKYRRDGSWYWQYYWAHGPRYGHDYMYDYPGKRRHFVGDEKNYPIHKRYKKIHSGYAKGWGCGGRTRTECGSSPKCSWQGTYCGDAKQSPEGNLPMGPVNWHDQAYFGY